MSETLGSLVDKLCICNLKLWHCQDKVFQASASGTGLDVDTARALTELNLQRNRLATEIDQTLARAVETGKAEVDNRYKVTP